MSCDIHLWAEVRSGAGQWFLLRPSMSTAFVRELVALHGAATEEQQVALDSIDLLSSGEDDEEISFTDERVYGGGQDYSLFSVLAGVRRREGDQPKIDGPRGVPPDASEAYKAILEAWGSDAHSRSYVTFDELRTHRDCHDAFHDIMNNLSALVPGATGDAVRIVFFFDN